MVSAVQIEIRVYSTLREVFRTGLLQIDINETETLADVITKLGKAHGDAYRLKTGRSLFQALEKRFNIFVNGEKVKLPLSSRLQLKDNDKILILQPVSGG